MKRFFLFVFLVISISLLAACGSNEEKTVVEKEADNIKELVNNFTVGNIKDKSASITSDELIVTNSDESQEIYDISEEEFFVSIAPYINETHP